eukprot:TRINITY_DN67611_c2_g1_i1.p1 TRINITY_DN67611_c2_g1~~TRINITY_DN67611_c2_g1_i1.p1  ORF type:complete len:389 (-),score=24.81 TRINITY_DN67611_c2_g1_i1:238-1404(-)
MRWSLCLSPKDNIVWLFCVLGLVLVCATRAKSPSMEFLCSTDATVRLHNNDAHEQEFSVVPLTALLTPQHPCEGQRKWIRLAMNQTSTLNYAGNNIFCIRERGMETTQAYSSRADQHRQIREFICQGELSCAGGCPGNVVNFTNHKILSSGGAHLVTSDDSGAITRIALIKGVKRSVKPVMEKIWQTIMRNYTIGSSGDILNNSFLVHQSEDSVINVWSEARNRVGDRPAPKLEFAVLMPVMSCFVCIDTKLTNGIPLKIEVGVMAQADTTVKVALEAGLLNTNELVLLLYGFFHDLNVLRKQGIEHTGAHPGNLLLKREKDKQAQFLWMDFEVAALNNWNPALNEWKKCRSAFVKHGLAPLFDTCVHSNWKRVALGIWGGYHSGQNQ